MVVIDIVKLTINFVLTSGFDNLPSSTSSSEFIDYLNVRLTSKQITQID